MAGMPLRTSNGDAETSIPRDKLHCRTKKAGVMVVIDSTRNFEAMVAHYEATGWEIRTIDHAALRATVWAGAGTVGNGLENASATAGATASLCRKLWVDSKGEVQETNVPC